MGDDILLAAGRRPPTRRPTPPRYAISSATPRDRAALRTGMASLNMARLLEALFFTVLVSKSAALAAPVHVWEKQDLTFTASRSFTNAYTDVIVWVDLTGPGFKKRVY